MAKVDLIMPKMGESITEATILKWTKKVGEAIALDETILEIATDKVDSDIPSPVEGTLSEILFKEGDVVEVGKVVARIQTDAVSAPTPAPAPAPAKKEKEVAAPVVQEKPQPTAPTPAPAKPATNFASSNGQGRFYSPLVKSMAKAEGISIEELNQVVGTGAKDRVTKKDMVTYLANRTSGSFIAPTQSSKPGLKPITPAYTFSSDGDEIIEMDRMRKLIADHMVMSKHTSPHVTSFIEADVTDIVNWRTANKVAFQQKYGQKITYTPIIMEAVVKAIGDFPLINVSVNGTQIIVKKNINIGMATALPSGNLIVPVIKNADRYNLAGMATEVNELAAKARANKLRPEDIQDGTFTVTNVGTFGNVMGTPIINQPQVAILAAGAIRKKPAVLETEYGDVIAIRQMMFLSLSYDHRVVDGFLGGSFLRRIGDYLEQFDRNQKI